MRVHRLLTTLSVVAALVLTAQAEWTLALAAGWHVAVAWAWPASLDTYVLASFRAGRDRAWALGLMAVSVMAAHAVPIAYPGGLPWWCAGGLSVIPPLVAWRVHELSRPAVTPVTAPVTVPGDVVTPVTPTRDAVAAIRAAEPTVTQAEVARRLEVTRQTINRHWPHTTPVTPAVTPA